MHVEDAQQSLVGSVLVAGGGGTIRLVVEHAGDPQHAMIVAVEHAGALFGRQHLRWTRLLMTGDALLAAGVEHRADLRQLGRVGDLARLAHDADPLDLRLAHERVDHRLDPLSVVVQHRLARGAGDHVRDAGAVVTQDQVRGSLLDHHVEPGAKAEDDDQRGCDEQGYFAGDGASHPFLRCARGDPLLGAAIASWAPRRGGRRG